GGGGARLVGGAERGAAPPAVQPGQRPYRLRCRPVPTVRQGIQNAGRFGYQTGGEAGERRRRGDPLGGAELHGGEDVADSGFRLGWQRWVAEAVRLGGTQP